MKTIQNKLYTLEYSPMITSTSFIFDDELRLYYVTYNKFSFFWSELDSQLDSQLKEDIR